MNFTNSTDTTELHASSVLFALTLIATFGAFIRYVLKRVWLRIPYTAILLIGGVILGAVAGYLPTVNEYVHYIDRVDAQVIGDALLPVIMFESAISIDFHIFIRSFLQCLVLCIIGLLLSCGLTAFFAMLVFPYEWDMTTGWLFGFILSVTDPTSVMSLLRDVGNSRILVTLLEGEALLNAGSSFVGFQVCFELLRRKTLEMSNQQTIDFDTHLFIIKAVKKIVLSPLFGYVTGAATIFCLARVFKDEVIEITITLCSAYLTYSISELVGLSGVISVVTLGLMISAHKESINPEIEIFVRRFWEMLSYLSQTAIFVAVGLILTLWSSLKEHEPVDWFFMFVTYAAIVLIRLFTLFALKPVLSRLGYGMDVKSALVITWAGVRGTLTLLLALLVATKHHSINAQLRHKVLCLVTGVVGLTLLINSTSLKLFLRRLGMDRISAERLGHMANAIRHLNACQQTSIHVQKKIHLYAHVDWDYVRTFTCFKSPYETAGKKQNIDEHLMMEDMYEHSYKNMQISDKEMKEIENDYRLDIISAQKVIYWREFQEGLLAMKEVSFLLSLAENAADKPDGYIQVKDLQENWKISRIWWKFERLLRFRKPEETTVKMSKLRQITRGIVKHRSYEIIVMAILAVNIGMIIKALSSANSYKNWTGYMLQIISNALFVYIYLLDMLLKVLALSWTKFWKDHNNKIDFTINIFIIIESTVEFVYVVINSHNITGNFVTMIHLVKLIRALKFVRLMHVFRQILLHIVKRHIRGKLFAEFNVGCAYHNAETEILRLLDEIIEVPAIAENTQERCEQNLHEINKQLAHFKDVYPDTAVAVTTRRATRSTLNELHQQINYLQSAGLIEDIIHRSLLEICEEKIKRLYSSPTKLKSHTPQDILKDIDWIAGDNELYVYLQNRFHLITFKEDDMITRYADPPQGIKIITMGTIKVTGVIVHDVNGGIPNTDSFHWFSVTKYLEDYLTVGSVLGELGFLTGKSYCTVATCQCEVEVISISEEVLREAASIFDSFESSLLSRMWRSCSLRIARRIFTRSGYYQDWELQKILRRMDTAYLPNIERCIWYNITAEMEHIALLQGVATDPVTSKTYIGPCNIPRNIGSLTFRPDAVYHPILLIIGTASMEIPRALELRSGRSASVTDTRMNLARVIRSYSLHRASLLGRKESRSTSEFTEGSYRRSESRF